MLDKTVLDDMVAQLEGLETQRKKMQNDPTLFVTEKEVDSGREVSVAVGELAELDQRIEALAAAVEDMYAQDR